ncbi:hypothetical protein PRIPAC_76952 [Pristionchus pacificus]|uniref:Uncharacterized protein n=1 Tax=Pristionchus pacificus TaxID=54126 RepID=A0A2A6CKJ1_PRIPA|nr:hypothetical protein PRIPAC_76952 [Pristionchus pacificus]|eukprot:PDM78745.1 hypothetical protein PRIPAC_31324 [Pristionchus pacificus]
MPRTTGANIVQEQINQWTTAIQNKFFSFDDDLLDVVDPVRGDSLTQDCKEDMRERELVAARLRKFNYPEFAEQVWMPNTAKHNPVCAVHRMNDTVDPVDAGFYVTITIMGVIFALCILSGVCDFYFSENLQDKPASKSFPWRLFMSFSLYANVASIFDTSGAKKDGQIAPIHCIRIFSMCWMSLGHMTASITAVISNSLDVFVLTQDATTEFILNAYFSVDSFFFVGGLLLTFLWFKSFYRNPKQTNSLGEF